MVVGITESAGKLNTEWLLNTFYAKENAALTEQGYMRMWKTSKKTPAGADYLIMTPGFRSGFGKALPPHSTMFNLSHEHTRAHIACAHFEGIAYNFVGQFKI